MRHSAAQRPDPRRRQHPNGWLRSWAELARADEMTIRTARRQEQ
jgi:hypothetical protein